MSTDIKVPFSATTRGSKGQIDNDFPIGARVLLQHLLHELVRKDYLEGWDDVVQELARMARNLPPEPDQYGEQRAWEILQRLSWDRVYDFCERLHQYVAKDYSFMDSRRNQRDISRSDVQVFISSELNRLFMEEALAYEFREGQVHRRGRPHSVDKISNAGMVLGDLRLTEARNHYNKALKFFRHPSNPDYENAVKEAVCAVEAAGKRLFPDVKHKTLDDVAKWLTGSGELLPKTLGNTITGLYGFRNSGAGVAHGGASGGTVTAELAEYVLAVAASQIILFVDIAGTNDEEIPF